MALSIASDTESWEDPAASRLRTYPNSCGPNDAVNSWDTGGCTPCDMKKDRLLLVGMFVKREGREKPVHVVLVLFSVVVLWFAGDVAFPGRRRPDTGCHAWHRAMPRVASGDDTRGIAWHRVASFLNHVRDRYSLFGFPFPRLCVTNDEERRRRRNIILYKAPTKHNTMKEEERQGLENERETLTTRREELHSQPNSTAKSQELNTIRLRLKAISRKLSPQGRRRKLRAEAEVARRQRRRHLEQNSNSATNNMNNRNTDNSQESTQGAIAVSYKMPRQINSYGIRDPGVKRGIPKSHVYHDCVTFL